MGKHSGSLLPHDQTKARLQPWIQSLPANEWWFIFNFHFPFVSRPCSDFIIHSGISISHFLSCTRQAGGRPRAPAICLHMGIHSLRRIRALAGRGPSLKYYSKHQPGIKGDWLGVCVIRRREYLHHLLTSDQIVTIFIGGFLDNWPIFYSAPSLISYEKQYPKSEQSLDG